MSRIFSSQCDENRFVCLLQIGIAYRELKPENFMIVTEGHVVLTDFDLCKKLLPHEMVSCLSAMSVAMVTCMEQRDQEQASLPLSS
jgi:serine/threonine protein kinase